MRWGVLDELPGNPCNCPPGNHSGRTWMASTAKGRFLAATASYLFVGGGGAARAEYEGGDLEDCLAEKAMPLFCQWVRGGKAKRGFGGARIINFFVLVLGLPPFLKSFEGGGGVEVSLSNSVHVVHLPATSHCVV